MNLSMLRTCTLEDQFALNQKVMNLQQVAEKVTKAVQLLRNLMDGYKLVELKTGDNWLILQQVTEEVVSVEAKKIVE